MFVPLVLALVLAITVTGQRPSFAGTRPIGYPELYDRTTTPVDELGNRFGEGTTERLPLEANGDRDLIDRISRLPIDQQPFWYINWKALEEHRKNPQTYPLNANSFIDPNPGINSATGLSNPNTGSTNSNSGFNLNNAFTVPNTFTNSNAPSQGSNNGIPSFDSGFQNPNNQFSNVGLGNRFNEVISGSQNAPNADLYNNLPNFDFVLHNTSGGTSNPSTSSTNNVPFLSQNVPKIQSFSNFPPNSGSGGANTISLIPTTVNPVQVPSNGPQNDIPNFGNGVPNSGIQNPNKVNKTNTQIIKSNSNTKNANTGIRTASNIEVQNTNSYFINGNPSPGIQIPVVTNTGPANAGNAQISSHQGVTDIPNTGYSTSTYSYGYQNHYKYKYNYQYEIPYTYTITTKHHN